MGCFPRARQHVRHELAGLLPTLHSLSRDTVPINPARCGGRDGPLHAEFPAFGAAGRFHAGPKIMVAHGRRRSVAAPPLIATRTLPAAQNSRNHS